MQKILLIDNYDSFVYNLYQYFIELGADVSVVRNDKISLEEVGRLKLDKIVISPGPGRPEKAGVSVPLIRAFCDKVPILGVCLGHQAVGLAFGAKIVRAKKIMHGKTSLIYHDKKKIFKGLPLPFSATRYHSLIIDGSSLPSILKVTASTPLEVRPRGTTAASDSSLLTRSTQDKEIMAVEVRGKPCFGIQFHPESILTKEGKHLLNNFLKL